jgi:hypothetical protein
MAGGNSADRRKERRASQVNSRSEIIAGCMAGALTIVLLFKHDTVTWTITLLVGLWLLVFAAALQLSPIRREHRTGHKVLNIVIAFLAISAGVTSFGFNVWPKPGLGTLTASQRSRIATALKGTREPWLVHLMCSPNDEKDCVVATQFISLFEVNGWHVKNRAVERILNGAPKTGLYFVLHSTIDPDPSKPGTGAWTEMAPGFYAVKPAFDELTPTDLVVGFSFPEHELGIYFGIGTAR